MGTQIRILRKKQFCGSGSTCKIEIDGALIGQVKSGAEFAFELNEGVHRFRFIDSFDRVLRTGTLTVNGEQDILINIQYNISTGKLDVFSGAVVCDTETKANLSGALNAMSNQPQAVATTNDEVVSTTQATGIHCPRCGSHDMVPVSEVSTQGKDFNAGDACCGWMLCGPIGLLCGARGKGKQTITTTYWMCKGCGNKFKA